MQELKLEVIPVIDLKGKQVVRAKMGERHFYAPLVTPLAATSEPADVIRGFLSLHPFRTIYVADLDAIEGLGTHNDILEDLQAAFPALTFWVDPGVKSFGEAVVWLKKNRAHLVIGSESFADVEALPHLRDEPRLILSLDFRGDAFQGLGALLENADFWPQRVIVMTLARVGSGAGPDTERVTEILKRAETRDVYAAGGLRGKEDLMLLHTTGAAGVLVASALHHRRLSGDDLAACEGNPIRPASQDIFP
jgi:phosphoribosylformimino-5-aminoimidazole carboxamide ribotide isomerase